MKGKYKHLFFDLDHTLWDFESNSKAVLLHLYKEHDLFSKGIHDFEAFYKSYSGHNDKLWARYRNGFVKREELRWKRIWLALLDFKIPDTELAHSMGDAYLELLPTQTLLMPHAKELLDYCTPYYQLHLITNGFEKTQHTKLKNCGLTPYFLEVITSEKSQSIKPKKEIFEYALNLTGAKKEESLMIGDALEVDILGAYNAGWDQLYYNPLRIQHNQKPTYEFHCWGELMKLL